MNVQIICLEKQDLERFRVVSALKFKKTKMIIIIILPYFRPPDEIPRQIFSSSTMQRESNGSGINLNIGPPPSCAPPTPPKKTL